eukprot:TRINITY_DN65765_c0_g1_i2.p1 TRINITY_DN65765_c0_g1~~TRINITY_DN65765_c0_g1_i2.p1  ORF type:complete len:173 (-),score=13.86 TRINITY_DN65765_c0_g1_i2:65-583(-)
MELDLTIMLVSISVSRQDQGTAHIADLVREPLDKISAAVSGEYGGIMDHLFIDLELSPVSADFRPVWSFRFQKRVSPRPLVAGLPKVEYHNVGHYSVRPDYFALAEVAPDGIARYLMDRIYESTSVLEAKQTRLGGFNAAAFRLALLEAIIATQPAVPADVLSAAGRRQERS